MSARARAGHPRPSSARRDRRSGRRPGGLENTSRVTAGDPTSVAPITGASRARSHPGHKTPRRDGDPPGRPDIDPGGGSYDMAVDVTRRRFVAGSAAVGAGLALGGPMSALASNTRRGRRPPRVVGYGPLVPTPEEDSGEVFLELPRGFRYRVINREGQTMSGGNPTPGIFDGTGCYPGPRGTVILVRNHENRSRDLEIPVVVPNGLRYDPDPNVRGGNTKLVVDRSSRRVIESFAVLAGTHTNCAGGVTPWNTWITCEEIFNYGSDEDARTPDTPGVPHGYSFEIPADADGPVDAVPIRPAGRFAHEAVAWLDGVLYETEDDNNAAFYRFLPKRRPR